MLALRMLASRVCCGPPRMAFIITPPMGASLEGIPRGDPLGITQGDPPRDPPGRSRGRILQEDHPVLSPVGIPGGPIAHSEFDESVDPVDSNTRDSTRVPPSPGSASSVKPPRDLAETSAARSVSLKTESHLLGNHLREMLQARMEVCGIKIVSFELSDLAYAAEVAPMMLARQQAVALVDARATIVDGAVRIVDRATRRLAELGHAASAGDRARLATNMMTVLAGETRPQPTISLSEAEFLPSL